MFSNGGGCLREHRKWESSQLLERAWIQDLDSNLVSLSLSSSILSSHFYLAFLSWTMTTAESSFSSALNLFGGIRLPPMLMLWIQWQDLICHLLVPALEKRNAMVSREADILSPVEAKHTEYERGCPGPISGLQPTSRMMRTSVGYQSASY